jgi:glycerol-3-phosphate acyltransferase PlsY
MDKNAARAALNMASRNMGNAGTFFPSLQLLPFQTPYEGGIFAGFFLRQRARTSITFWMPWIPVLATAAIAYLLGSIPSGFIAGKMCGKDLRKEGSGNIGATNALRVLGKKWGYSVFAFDALKGFVGVKIGFWIAANYLPGQEIPLGILAAACTVLGHNFPVWLGFKGGKGIATSGGIMLSLFPPLVFITGFIIWMSLFFSTRYVSIASIGAAISMPLSSALLTLTGSCDWLRTAIAVIMCLLAIWRHRSNIQRLRDGTEKRFEKKGR